MSSGFAGTTSADWTNEHRKHVVDNPVESVSPTLARDLRLTLEGPLKRLLVQNAAAVGDVVALDNIVLFLRSLGHSLFQGDNVMEQLLESRRGGIQNLDFYGPPRLGPPDGKAASSTSVHELSFLVLWATFAPGCPIVLVHKIKVLRHAISGM